MRTLVQRCALRDRGCSCRHLRHPDARKNDRDQSQRVRPESCSPRCRRRRRCRKWQCRVRPALQRRLAPVAPRNRGSHRSSQKASHRNQSLRGSRSVNDTKLRFSDRIRHDPRQCLCASEFPPHEAASGIRSGDRWQTSSPFPRELLRRRANPVTSRNRISVSRCSQPLDSPR